MYGGTGADTYVVDDINDIVDETVDQPGGVDDGSIDTVLADLPTYTLGEFIENLTLLGVSNLNGVGNELNNRITGNAGNNLLTGNDGNDTLIGGAGTFQ